MYVFNGEYTNFLRIMTKFKINRNKFKHLKDYKNEESHKKILNKLKDESDDKTHFLYFIIYSGLAFIFLYIPNSFIDKYQEIKNKVDYNNYITEMEKLKKESEMKISKLEEESAKLKKESEMKISKLEGESAKLKIESDVKISKLEGDSAKMKEESEQSKADSDKQFADLKNTIKANSNLIQKLIQKINELENKIQEKEHFNQGNNINDSNNLNNNNQTNNNYYDINNNQNNNISIENNKMNNNKFGALRLSK